MGLFAMDLGDDGPSCFKRIRFSVMDFSTALPQCTAVMRDSLIATDCNNSKGIIQVGESAFTSDAELLVNGVVIIDSKMPQSCSGKSFGGLISWLFADGRLLKPYYPLTPILSVRRTLAVNKYVVATPTQF